MDQTRKKKGRVQLILIMLFFLGPLIVTWWMYFGQIWQPAGRTNHGELLDPVINLWERQAAYRGKWRQLADDLRKPGSL